MPRQFVAQVVEVRLNPDADNIMTKRAYDATIEWLAQWTPQRNFQAVIAHSETEALQVLRDDLRKKMIPARMNTTPDLFQFKVAIQEAKDGRFWMPSYASQSVWHDVGHDIQGETP